jgi:hypothetical protein
MLKTIVVITTLTLALTFGGAGRAAAQDSEASKAAAAEKLVNAYRLDFSVNELEDGKKINTRQYSMNVNNEDSNEIKIGTRVPVEGKQGEFQYLDVGTNIWCKLSERGGTIPLSVRAEISNFAMPEQQNQQTRPVLRQLSIRAATLAQLGKLMALGSVDDPNSKRQFQLEVTVTKLK